MRAGVHSHCSFAGNPFPTIPDGIAACAPAPTPLQQATRAPLTLPPRPLCVVRPHARRHTHMATRLSARRLGTSTAHARRKSASCMGTRAAAVGSTRRRSRPERRWQGAAALWHSLPRCLSTVQAGPADGRAPAHTHARTHAHTRMRARRPPPPYVKPIPHLPRRFFRRHVRGVPADAAEAEPASRGCPKPCRRANRMPSCPRFSAAATPALCAVARPPLRGQVQLRYQQRSDALVAWRPLLGPRTANSLAHGRAMRQW